MTVHFKQVAIIGVGLIGGSLGMILRRKALADHIVGIGRRVENLKTAVELGAIDRYVADPKAGVQGADLVILATPVDTYERHLKEWAHCLRPGAIVSDVGSVKGMLVEQSEAAMPAGVDFVGAHPIAGKEKTGVAAGSDQLFKGARCILTPTKRTDPQALERIRQLWEETGSIVLTMDPHRRLCVDERIGGSSGSQIGRVGSCRPLRRRVAGYDQNRRQFTGDVARYFLVESK
jgi:prephenate dehydrogenase